MARVFKCDICGEIYKDKGKQGPQHSHLSVYNNYIHSLDAFDSSDLCPECTKRVQDFIDILKTGDEYVIVREPMLTRLREIDV